MTMFARAAPESAKKSAVSNAPDRAQWLHAQKPARPPQYRPYNAVWPSRIERSTFTERTVGHVLRGSAGSPAISCRAETLAAEFEGPPAFAGPQWSFGKIALFAPGDPPPPPICLQRKLTIRSVNDPLEREADRVAGEVMRMPDSKVSVGAEPLQMRRKCAACQEEEEAKTLRTKSASPLQAVTDGPPDIVHEVLRSPGQPLDAEARSFFEPRFGYDFGHVRLHFDEKADASARSVGALAYTVGSHVAFRSASYSPRTADGRQLLAHELTHVVQQSASTGFRPASPSPAGAQASAAAVVADRNGGALLHSGRAVQRQPAPSPEDRANAAADAAARRELESTLPGPGGTPQPQKPKTAQRGVGCDDGQRRRAEDALKTAVHWLDNALGKLDPPLPEVSAPLFRHFHVNPKQPWFVAQVRDNLQRIHDGLAGSPYRCGGNPECWGQNASVLPHEVLLCEPFFTQSDDNVRAQTLIHEAAHVFAHARAEMGGKTAIDRSLSTRRAYARLTPDEALSNADSYGAFLQEVVGHRVGPAAPQDTFTGCTPGQAEQVRDALAFVEQWNDTTIDTLSRTDPKEIAHFEPLRRRYFGSVDRDEIKGKYFKVSFKLSASIPFSCEQQCDDRDAVGYYDGGNILHLCPYWFSSRSRAWNLYRLMLRAYGDVPQSWLNNYAGFARAVAQERLPPPG